MTPRRKLAVATWSSTCDASIYLKLTVDVDPVLTHLRQMNANATDKITITHFVGKAVGHVLSIVPNLNGRIAWGRYVPHKSVDIAFLVNMDQGRNLGRVKVRDVSTKSLSHIASDLHQGTQHLRQGSDKNHNKGEYALRILPTWLIRPIVNFLGYLSGAIGIPLPLFGMEAFPFGSCVITNVGSFGVDNAEAYVPSAPFIHVPLYVVILAMMQRPVVRNGQVTIAQQMDLTFTIDHRFVDGYAIAQFVYHIKKAFSNPSQIK